MPTGVWLLAPGLPTFACCFASMMPCGHSHPSPQPMGKRDCDVALVSSSACPTFHGLALYDDVRVWEGSGMVWMRSLLGDPVPTTPFPAHPFGSSITACVPVVCVGCRMGMCHTFVTLLSQDLSPHCPSPSYFATLSLCDSATFQGVSSRHTYGPIQLFVVVAIFSSSMQYSIPLLPQLDNVP